MLEFEPYHVHTCYSNCLTQPDSTMFISDYAKAYRERGHHVLCMSEHGNRSNVWEQFDICEAFKSDKDKKGNPQRVLDDFSRLSPTNYFTVNEENLEIQTDLGGIFAILDLNGSVLYKARIQKGLTSMKVPAKAKNKLWIATLNGKMMSR